MKTKKSFWMLGCIALLVLTASVGCGSGGAAEKGQTLAKGRENSSPERVKTLELTGFPAVDFPGSL